MNEKLRESDLYPAIRNYLTGLGYDVKGEITGCDIVGIKANRPIDTDAGLTPPSRFQDDQFILITEMKLGFTLDLVLQGVERSSFADHVWLAVKATRRGRDRDTRVRNLCRLLGFGLMAVQVPQGKVEILAEPAPYRPRPNLRRRNTILSEHRRRKGDPSSGGIRGLPIVTAYRQEALVCAQLLQAGPARPRDLRAQAPRAAAILQRNVYGWFVRLERGLYSLTPSGRAALLRWSH